MQIMREQGGFNYTLEELEGPIYRQKALPSEKESDKFYPGIKNLKFELFSFKLSTQ